MFIQDAADFFPFGAAGFPGFGDEAAAEDAGLIQDAPVFPLVFFEEGELVRGLGEVPANNNTNVSGKGYTKYTRNAMRKGIWPLPDFGLLNLAIAPLTPLGREGLDGDEGGGALGGALGAGVHGEQWRHWTAAARKVEVPGAALHAAALLSGAAPLEECFVAARLEEEGPREEEHPWAECREGERLWEEHHEALHPVVAALMAEGLVAEGLQEARP